LEKSKNIELNRIERRNNIMPLTVLEKQTTGTLNKKIDAELEKIMWGRIHVQNMARLLKHLYNEIGIELKDSDIDLYAMFALLEREASTIAKAEEQIEILIKENLK
jgi:hypothetical protein